MSKDTFWKIIRGCTASLLLICTGLFAAALVGGAGFTAWQVWDEHEDASAAATVRHEQLLLEADRRGLLTGQRKAAFDEALRRGIIQDPAVLSDRDLRTATQPEGAQPRRPHPGAGDPALRGSAEAD